MLPVSELLVIFKVRCLLSVGIRPLCQLSLSLLPYFSRACILRVCAGYATLNLASNGLSASNSIVFAQYTLALLELNHIMLYMINDKLKKDKQLSL